MSKWKNDCLLIFTATVVIGCSSTPIQEPATERERLYFWNKGAIAAIGNAKSDGVSKKLFDFYCRDGKQAVPVKKYITAILGKAPHNIPLDNATNLRSQQKERIEKAIRGFFSINGAVFRDFYSPSLKMRSTLLWTDANSNQAMSNAIKSIEISCDHSINCNPPTFVDTGGDILTFLTGFPSILDETGKATETFPGGNHFVTIDFNKQSSRPCRKTDGQRCQEGKVPTYQSVNLILPEASLLTREYVLLMSRKELDVNLGGELRKIGKGVAGADYLFGNEESENISNLIQYSPAIWSAYFSIFTQMAEVQSQDPQIINYEVVLDLNLFCRSAQKTSTLVSK